jgi:hypothetical protein
MKKLLLVLGAVGVAAGLAVPAGCSKPPQPAMAAQVTSRDQLIGGQRALGEIGDFKLSNGLVHAVVQNIGNSRGFGVFGGSLIDVDLVRGGKTSSATGVAGNDYFTEMFPAFFLKAIEPEKVEVAEDGSGGRAVIRVSGRGGDFLSLTKSINDVVIGKGPIAYQVDYILEPGKQYLKLVTTIINTSKTDSVNFPLAIPFGYITLLGEGQRLFVPGKAGYDMRYRLDEVYKQPSGLEAFPGEVASMMTTEGAGVSYGVAAGPRGAGYMSNNPTYYPTAKPDSLLIPLASGSFLATFWGKPPPSIDPGKSYKFVGYLAIGNGDVASVQKVIYGIDDEEGGRKPVATGTVSGTVREDKTGAGLEGVTVVLQDAKGLYVASARTAAQGRYSMPVPPGKYRASASDKVRSASRSADLVDVAEGGVANIDLAMERPATLSVSVHDERGRPLPSKISVEATYDHQGAEPPRDFLYDLKIGERARPSDLDPDAADPASRRYLETSFFAVGGAATKAVKAGTYKVYASRGIEYDLASEDVVLAAGEDKQVRLTLHQVLPTPGYVSTDLHVHSVNSVDSDMPLAERVSSYAAEGVDFLASTDHNYVSDFGPTVEGLALSDWLKTTVGLELTSLEMGHFNAFPLKVAPGPVTHGSFDWFRRPPGELFANLRSLGKNPQETLVQVNHPRDSIMGYFTQFNMGAYTGKPQPFTGSFHLDTEPAADGTPSPYAPENFSLDFEIIEVFNGKHLELVHNYRVPVDPGPGDEPSADVTTCPAKDPLVGCLPAVGQVAERSVKLPDGGVSAETEPLYPGGLDDYYTLVGKVKKLTAVGNSDSHGASAEAGLPRTYVWVGDSADGSMRGLDEASVMKGLKEHRAYVTNGPIIGLTVNDQPIGSEVVSADGTARVHVTVQAAPWVDVTQVVVKRGGKDIAKEPEVLEVIPVPSSTELSRLDVTRTYSNLPDDSFVVIEVSGGKSMWPVFTPHEVVSIQINEAVGTIGSTFGYSNKFGRYKPQQIQQIIPFAVSNPIWVVRAQRQALTATKRVLPIGQKRAAMTGRVPDLRMILGNLHGDTE